MITTDRATLRFIQQANDLASAKLPKEAQRAITAAERLDAEGLTLATTEELTDAVLDAFAAGKHPADDPAVLALISRRSLAGMFDSRYLLERALHRAVLACAEHADQIIKGWRPTFDKAAETLTAAVAVIGDRDLEDHADILRAGGRVAEHHVKAVDAEKTITTIVTAWTVLAQAARVTIHPTTATRLAAVTFVDVERIGAKPRPWDAARADLTLSLPSLEEYRARVRQAEPPADPSAAQVFRESRKSEADAMRRAWDQAHQPIEVA